MLLTLPQETLYEIIAHLRGEERALQSLALVDRRLTEECRRLLFSSIHVDSTTKFVRLTLAISPEGDGLSRYVRLLSLEGEELCSLAFLRNHLFTLRSFTQLEHLKIRPLELTWFENGANEMAHYLGHFPNVRSVHIQPIGSHHQTLLDFLALFPLLETTVITSPYIWPGALRIPNFVCRGNLVLRACKVGDVNEIFPFFTRPTTTRYRSVGFEYVSVFDFSPFEHFFGTCGSSLESIHFINCLISVSIFPETLLSTLTNLRDIALSLRFVRNNPDVATILSSITSTKIDSVTLIIWDCYYPNDLENFCSRWTSIENALCRLSGLRRRAECEGKVVLNVHFVDRRCAIDVLGLAERGEFMPRFQEGGVVKVETRTKDVNHVVSSIVPEEFRC
ncbi:hypothetical protein BJ322DRAFT_1173063 [Thelephora terrestris]|uniref:F-box domain-containing protein n=1 Tax=Thelephora terrestris TaxID=56493 RepID=A0A9P6H731_9AGAM|nr:hypothetical protein BJ322DRAFT_1173063 [Thelephora terrestris]